MEKEIKYIVTADDLIGDIKIFPIEVVQKMVDCQIKQGNAPDVVTFQKDCFTSRYDGGFDWYDTDEGADFWSKVMDDKNFDVFFEKYPKSHRGDDPGPKGKKGVDGSNEVKDNRYGLTGPVGSNDYGCAGVFLPKQGEYVLVSQDGYSWHELIFLFENDNIYYCLGENDEKRFNEPGIKFNLSVNGWKFCKPIENSIKLTIENPKGKNIYYINKRQFKLIQNIINNKH